jgi:hypothetical protein
MNNIIFTTTEPSFMAGVFNTEADNASARKRTDIIIDKYNTAIPVNNTKTMSCYFEGDLEAEMGYDCPVLIEGSIPKLSNGDILSVMAVTLDGKELDAVMLVGYDRGMSEDEDNFWLYSLILTLEDAESLLSNGITDTFGDYDFTACTL